MTIVRFKLKGQCVICNKPYTTNTVNKGHKRCTKKLEEYDKRRKSSQNRLREL